MAVWLLIRRLKTFEDVQMCSHVSSTSFLIKFSCAFRWKCFTLPPTHQNRLKPAETFYHIKKEREAMFLYLFYINEQLLFLFFCVSLMSSREESFHRGIIFVFSCHLEFVQSFIIWELSVGCCLIMLSAAWLKSFLVPEIYDNHAV